MISYSLDKKQLWDTIHKADRIFYSTSAKGTIDKAVVYDGYNDDELKKQAEIAAGGRQKRKEQRRLVAQQNHINRNSRHFKIETEEKELEEVAESPRMQRNEHEEEQEEKVYVKIISENAVPRVRARKVYGNSYLKDRNPSKKKLRWQDYS